jgi:hypothetical protein
MPFALADKQLPLAESLQQLVVDIQHRRFALPERLSEGAQDLLTRLLQPEPHARINMAGEGLMQQGAFGLVTGSVTALLRRFVCVNSWTADGACMSCA